MEQANEIDKAGFDIVFPYVLMSLLVLFLFVVSINIGRWLTRTDFINDCERYQSVRIKSRVYSCAPTDASVYEPARPSKTSSKII